MESRGHTSDHVIPTILMGGAALSRASTWLKYYDSQAAFQTCILFYFCIEHSS